ncbi:MAG: leucine-rich repeat protein [Bacteroidaceae bacterium]|nr:leucine-rich repeat protein [Bacteroidaceae bacterium]
MKARKILMIMLTALTGTQAMYADDVSEAQARQIAVQMMNSFPQAKARRAKAVGSVEAPAPRLAYKAPSLADEAASPLYYVFNSAEADGGFVIVSGDDGTTTPVLGYSDHGSFSLDGAPENVRAMMERYAHQIEMLRAHPQTARSSSKRAPRRIETYTYSYGNTVVEPFVKTKWDQYAPYNLLCPKVDGENPTVTGCMNTAEAQILNYWQWPKRGRGSNSYYWNPTKTTRYDLSGDVNHTYDWDNMLDEYGENYTEAQGMAVAQLMVDIGIAHETGYGYEASYGGIDSQVFRKNFDYDADSMRTIGLYVDTLFFSDAKRLEADEFDEALRREMDKKRPVLLTAFPNDHMPYHAMVVDGYTDNGHFHMNFGWGGRCDGWYKTLIIDSDYSDSPSFREQRRYIELGAYIGIQPMYSTQRGNLYYRVHDGEAELVAVNAGGDVEVPASITDDEGKSCNVTSIKYAFWENDSLTSIKLPATIKYIGKGTFLRCKALTQVELPEGLETIDDEAFRECTALTEITLPASLLSLGKSTFEGCTALTTITLPASLQSLGERAFYGCTALTSVDMEELTIDTIPAYAFAYCRNLQYIALPQTVTVVADYAFAVCSSVNYILGTYHLRSIGAYAFEWTKPNGLIIDQLETADPTAFDNAEVATVDIGANASVQTMSWLPSSLKQVTIDPGNPYFTSVGNIVYSKDMTTLVYVSSLYNEMFQFMGRGLQTMSTWTTRTELDIPESVSRIDEYAVKRHLQKVTIPVSMTEIDSTAFNLAPHAVFSYAVEPPTGLGSKTVRGSEVHVPWGCSEAYEAAEGWREAASITEDLPVITYGNDEGTEEPDVDEEIARVNGVRVITNLEDGWGGVQTYEFLFPQTPIFTHETEVEEYWNTDHTTLWGSTTYYNIILGAAKRQTSAGVIIKSTRWSSSTTRRPTASRRSAATVPPQPCASA